MSPNGSPALQSGTLFLPPLSGNLRASAWDARASSASPSVVKG